MQKSRPHWLLLLTITCVSLTLFFHTISNMDTASADPFGGGPPSQGFKADGVFSNYCFDPSFNAGLFVQAHFAMENSLDADTDMITDFESPCPSGVDVKWDDADLDDEDEVRGDYTCLSGPNGAGECLSARVRLDPAQINIGSNDDEDQKKTACHEAGHSVGLEHGGGKTDCMINERYRTRALSIATTTPITSTTTSTRLTDAVRNKWAPAGVKRKSLRIANPKRVARRDLIMRKLTILGIAIVLGLVGCGRDVGPSANSRADLAAATSHNVSEFIAEMQRTHYDYEPTANPKALASKADAVVTGTIVDVTEGQSYAETKSSKPESVTSVIKIRVGEVITGSERFVFEGHVYVEVEHPAFLGSTEGLEETEGDPDLDPDQPETKWEPFDHESYAASVPRAEGIFFLHDRTDASYYPVVLEKGAGRPSGASLMGTYIQGFLIEDENGHLMSVREDFEGMPEAWWDLDSIEKVVSEIK